MRKTIRKTLSRGIGATTGTAATSPTASTWGNTGTSPTASTWGDTSTSPTANTPAATGSAGNRATNGNRNQGNFFSNLARGAVNGAVNNLNPRYGTPVNGQPYYTAAAGQPQSTLTGTQMLLLAGAGVAVLLIATRRE